MCFMQDTHLLGLPRGKCRCSRLYPKKPAYLIYCQAFSKEKECYDHLIAEHNGLFNVDDPENPMNVRDPEEMIDNIV